MGFWADDFRDTEENAVKGGCVGIGLGIALGYIVIGSIPMGIGIGLSFGCAAGALMGLYKDIKNTEKELGESG
ncbi:MAG: hypothetical protein IKJ87_04960 [Ruminococcus sp.]|nr:hypothetical protein [Ruminococcus sp.]